ncbi:MAG: DUF192 domain-containing protein [Clostridiales bacterium]|nr:DUF192 domain-containing protein [Clostridiales bacterium]
MNIPREPLARALTENDEVLFNRVIIAHSFWQKLFGLLPYPPLQPGEAMLLPYTRRVHTFGMRFHIDVGYLDKEGRLLYVETLPPQRLGSFLRAAAHVLEAPKGSLENLPPRSRILFAPLQGETTPRETKSQTGSGVASR